MPNVLGFANAKESALKLSPVPANGRTVFERHCAACHRLNQQGVEETVARSQITRLTASRLSLMPQEFEKSMTPQELADLLAYLKGEQ